MKFTKKPVEVNAEQWFPDKHIDGVIHPRNPPSELFPGEIETLEGIHLVSPGDWIITGVKGEKYPCKPDIFDLTYDKVD